MRGFPDVGQFGDDDDYRPPSGDKVQAFGDRPAPRVFTNLSAINLDDELTVQFAEATSFRDWILAHAEGHNPKDVTDSVKTVNTLLAQIVKMRETVQNIARMTALEEAVVETMKEFPEVREAFFERIKDLMK